MMAAQWVLTAVVAALVAAVHTMALDGRASIFLPYYTF
jgi:hypothetical protein